MPIPKKYLIETVILTEARIDNMSILRILTQDKQINKEDPNYNYYVQLANWANNRQEKTGKIDLTTIKLSDTSLIQKGKLAKNTKHLGATLEQLKNLMDQEGKYNPESELSKLIQLTTLEILTELSGIKNSKPPAEDPVETEPEDPMEKEYQKGKIDWTAYRAEKLAKDSKAGKPASKSLEEFQEFYYRKEYAGLRSAKEPDNKGIVAKLKSLDKILIPEFNKLGYNPEVNPLAQFLKILIKLKENDSTIFDKLTTNKYGAIHNSFIDKHITGNMLGNHRDDGKGDNLLFCEDLYNYNGLSIVNYLDLQKQVLNSAEASYPSVSNVIARVFIKQEQLNVDYVANAKALMEADETKIIKVEDSNAKLRSELEIRELYNHLFGTTAKKTLSDKIMQAIAVKAADNGATLDMVNYLLALVSTRALNPTKVTHYKEVYNELKQHGYKKNQVLYDWSREQLSSYSLEEDKKVMDLAVKLISVYNTKKQADAKKDK